MSELWRGALGSSAVWSVVLGAALALVGAFVVQVWIVPWVSRRSRALDRWEQDLLELGGILTIDLAAARMVAYDKWQRMKSLRAIAREYESTLSTQAFLEERDRQRVHDGERTDAFRSACDEYERITERVRWLAKRILARDTSYFPYVTVHNYAMFMTIVGPETAVVADLDSNEDVEKIEKRWEDESNTRNALVTAVEKLARDIAPPSPLGSVLGFGLRTLGRFSAPLRRSRKGQAPSDGG